MLGRVAIALTAAGLVTTGFAIAPGAEARTVVRVGIGVPLYPRPYRWGYYGGYYPPPRPYYYRPPPVVIGGYWGRPYYRRPYYHRPWYGRPRWRRW